MQAENYFNLEALDFSVCDCMSCCPPGSAFDGMCVKQAWHYLAITELSEVLSTFRFCAYPLPTCVTEVNGRYKK